MTNYRLTSEQIEDLAKALPTFRHQNRVAKTDLQEALELCGFVLAGYEIRDLQQGIQGDSLSVAEFEDILETVSIVKDASRSFQKDIVLSREKEELKTYANNQDSNGAKHTVSSAEERGYTEWINRSLGEDPDCAKHLPIRATSCSNLYESCKDGIVICKLINKAVRETVDERTLNKGSGLQLVFKRNENLVLAVNSAEAIGCCVVNIGPEDIANGTPHLVLGLIWQIIRIGLLGEINLTHHAELVALLRPGETLDDLRQLSPEELLLRWVNYHLERAGIDRRIKNFKEDIMDSEVYANLLNQIAPRDKRSLFQPIQGVLASSDLCNRAENVLQNADVLDARVFVTSDDIARANERGKNRDKLNLAFVANLFNNYPALEMPEDVVEIEETLEEKTYRNWMNSMGVEPFVKDLYADLRNGLILLQLLDILQPGIVEWSKVTRQFHPKKKVFEMQANCVLAIDYAHRIKNMKLVNISGEDIRQGIPKLTLGLCFQLMRAYTIKLLSNVHGDGQPIEDKHIVEWANHKCASSNKTSRISGFKDTKIATALPVLDLIDAIKPGAVDYGLVTGNNMANAKLAISLARKCGAHVYALPEHIVEVNNKMVSTVYACLMILNYQINRSA